MWVQFPLDDFNHIYIKASEASMENEALLPWAIEDGPIIGYDNHEREREFKESGDFIQVYEIAKQYGLESEFVVYYTRGIKDGYSIREAVNYAREEWDF